MTFEILVSCMTDHILKLIDNINLNSSAVIISQCGRQGYEELVHNGNKVKIYYSSEKGLTKSRNKALQKSTADICLLCDDDEQLNDECQKRVIGAFEEFPDADIIVFKVKNFDKKLKNKVYKLKYSDLFRVASIQIAFKRESILSDGIFFDEILGSGTGNGAEEELAFLMECRKRRKTIYYYPAEIATLKESNSTWFEAYGETFFFQRGKTTRYILGTFLSEIYAIYYVAAKHHMYKKDISFWKAFKAIHKGIYDDKLQRTSYY